MGRTERRGSVLGRDRSRLEAGLRQYYASAFDKGWDPEAESRILARVSRAIAARRMTSRVPGRTFRIKRVTGPHVAALVCAGAAVIAFGNMNGVGRDASHSYVPPTNAPLTGQPARPYANSRLSTLGDWSSSSESLARPI